MLQLLGQSMSHYDFKSPPRCRRSSIPFEILFGLAIEHAISLFSGTGFDYEWE